MKLVSKKGVEYVPHYSAQDDYDFFVSKFDPAHMKKTTDECLTPPVVYDAVLKYFVRRFPELASMPIVRPFYPGGDYEDYPYTENCAVVDNPPFSMLAKILRYYCGRDIPFILFCDGLTYAHHLVNSGCGAFDCNISIKYSNGATVKTAFLVRGFAGMNLVECDMELNDSIRSVLPAQNEAFRNRRLSANMSDVTKWRKPHEFLSCSCVSTLGANSPTRKFIVGFDEGCAVEFVGGHKYYGGGLLLRRGKVDERDAILAARDANVKVAELTDVEREFVEHGMPEGAYVTDSNPRIVRRGMEGAYPAHRDRKDRKRRRG